MIPLVTAQLTAATGSEDLKQGKKQEWGWTALQEVQKLNLPH